MTVPVNSMHDSGDAPVAATSDCVYRDADVVRFCGGLTIYNAAILHQQLPQIFSGIRGDFTVDLSAVSEIDSSGLQLLLSLRRSADAMGLGCEFVANSDCVAELLQFCGLTSHGKASEPASSGLAVAGMQEHFHD